jgi:hypothetical protein
MPLTTMTPVEASQNRRIKGKMRYFAIVNAAWTP